MTREEFLNLDEAEQDAFLLAADGNTTMVADLTAERDSLKNENDSLRAANTETAAELKKVKETNYTLVRKFGSQTDEDPEEVIYNMFK